MSNKSIILCVFVAVCLSGLVHPLVCFAGSGSKDDWLTIARQSRELGYKPRELIVRFAPKAGGKDRTRAERNLVLAKMDGGTVKRSYKLVPGLTLVKLPTGATVANTLTKFRNNKDVLYAHPNRYFKAVLSVPDDTRFDEQWALDNTGQSGGTPGADIDALRAWDITTGGDIVVAVIDSGVDYDRPELADNMWVNPGEEEGDGNGDGKPGVAGVDDDGDGLIDEDSEERQPGEPGYTNDLVNDDDENGYADDIYGYNFIYGNSDPDDDDEYSHGTSCAGIIGAVGNNDEGIAGVCWNVKIMALKWLSYSGQGYVEDAIDSIEYAVQMGAKVLSNSWAGARDEGLEDEIVAARNAGVLFVVAAGNSGKSHAEYPARYDMENIISVMATDHDDERSIFPDPYSSNWGAISVDLAAPGGSVGSVARNILTCARGGGYIGSYGTSMACPFVAGACALVWSRNPALSYLEVKDIILDTVDVIDALENDPEHGRLCVTGGRLNLYNAIVEAGNIDLTIDDGLGDDSCVLPEDFIEYRIWYANHITDANASDYVGDANDVVIVDYLPAEGAEFILAVPNTGEYDPNEGTYTWTIGKLSPGEGGLLYLKVQVSQTAEPLSEIVNRVEFESDVARRWATEKAAVCCYGGKVIYVDGSVVDANDGSSWSEAFDRLDDALAAASICDEIWVANGDYMPTTNPNNHKAKFSIPRGLWVYGGFVGDEKERYERNWYANQTVLNGVLDSAGNEPNRVDYVVVSDANNVLGIVDGFTIKGGSIAGVYCEGSSLLIRHNKITVNGMGIYCKHTKEPLIVNNWIYKNSCGLNFDDPLDVAIVRNNTVANNDEMGINLADGAEPDISNCIFAGHPAGCELVGCGASYSYIDYGAAGQGNIEGEPNFPPFVDGDNDDYRLDPCSACIDAGEPSGNYNSERDIDKHFRVLDGNDNDEKRVDMGADEYCNQGTDNIADFNDDDIVDTNDLVEMAAAWLIDDTDPCWAANYEKYDLNTDDVINYGDFAYFAKEWLWMTCEKMQGYEMMEMMMGAGAGESMLLAETAPVEAAAQSQVEPSVEEQIEQIEYFLDWLYEIKDQVDEDTWLNLTAGLEEMLEELQQE